MNIRPDMPDSINKERLKDNIVIFDGECVLCSYFFSFLVKYDHRKIYSFATLQSDTGKKIIAAAWKKEKIPDSVILYQKGKVYAKSAAAIRVVSGLGGIFRLAGLLHIFPKFLSDKIYDFVAKRRYKWWGRQTCLIPDDDIRSRFVDGMRF
ncbi:MAG TPA: DCC1-like thiol-disulfide oxidoreductase family protein [Saprospiraceae bacterium]|nr:DUF393 domain-containing protein [Saprospiraceae bacterium]HMV24514.1 DCC1-like thiol-disulfide oxidoreductase family protein [Saprospiraceae bacterium]HNM58285.1 DCC1-like thiol-disulfide oxidoreductase family protein [Saprospiraceae bacterium]